MQNIKTHLTPVEDEVAIFNEYTIFEENQVLTHVQLNGAIEYLNDQQRLTRVDLDGVGIWCGLRAALATDRVTVTRGLAVTTDGDLARVPDTLTFTQYRRYDDGAPFYKKLAPGGAPLETWELLPSTTTDARAAALSTFEATEGASLATLSALLLVESVDVDQDICLPEDCDSRGDTATDTLRFLLVDAGAAATNNLAGALPTPDAASRLIPELVPARPLLTGILDIDGLATAYRASCATMHDAIVAALPLLHGHAGAFLWDTDPTAPWVAKLVELRTHFAANLLGLQYYYGYLKDVIETYGALRAEMAFDTVVCGPDLDAFPKHVLLGRIAAGSGADARTGFYPSPALRAAVDRWAHARFLARKLGTLVLAFRIPDPAATSAGNGIRITPSFWGDTRLEERAIPYYYDPAFSTPLHEVWRHDYTLRGMSLHNQGYHARGWGAQGEAAAPFVSNPGKHDFFRVEGHHGRTVGEALAVLESKIRQNNLPITLATGLIRSTTVVTGEVESDVLESYNAFRSQFAQQIEQALVRARGLFARLPANSAARRLEQLEQRAPVALEGLRAPWEEAHADLGWRSAINDVVALVGQVNAEFFSALTVLEKTAFSALLTSTLPATIDELHALSLGTPPVGAARPLFVSHLQQQPGLEHFGGAARGATLLLVYDETERVIFDFMLPCCNCEVVAEADRPGGGVREAVEALYAKSGSAHDRLLRRGAELPADRLAEGLRVAPNTDLVFQRATDADCTVTLEAPFPQAVDDVGMFGGAGIGFQPVVLAGTVTASDGQLLWTPMARTAKWLQSRLPDLLGRPRIEFYSGVDEGSKVPWSVGVQHQLVYSEFSAQPLVSGQPVRGGAAVFLRPSSGGKVTLRAYWPQPLSMAPSGQQQVGVIYDWTGPRNFSVLLFEFRVQVGATIRTHSWQATPVTVSNGVAAFGRTETMHFAATGITNPIPSTPTQIAITEDGFEITEITTAGVLPPYRSSTKLPIAGTRIGVFTNSPVEIWELGDEVQALQPLHESRVRVRLHVDRDCATWAGPPGLQRPFIPDWDTWFWLRVGWPTPYGYGYAAPLPASYGLRAEYPGIGAELIQ